MLHPIGAPECSSKAPVTRHAMLSRDAHGPRAVLNALDRLAGSYEGQAATAGQDLAIAEGQLRDHEARLGQPFAHEAYLAELTAFRDQLKAGLSDTPPEPGADPLPSAAELAERIKPLKAAHSIEAAPARPAARTTRRRESRSPPASAVTSTCPLPEPIVEPEAVTAAAEPPPAAPLPQAEPVLLTLPPSGPGRRTATASPRIAAASRSSSACSGSFDAPWTS